MAMDNTMIIIERLGQAIHNVIERELANFFEIQLRYVPSVEEIQKKGEKIIQAEDGLILYKWLGRDVLMFKSETEFSGDNIPTYCAVLVRRLFVNPNADPVKYELVRKISSESPCHPELHPGG